MPAQEIEKGPHFVPVTSEVALIASTFNEKVYSNPQLYKTAFESGRLVTDKATVHYVPREGEDEALETINNVITSEHIRYLEIDPSHDDLFYDDPKQKDLLKRFQKAQGKHHETLFREVTAARVGFVIDQIVEYTSKQDRRKKRPVAKAG